MSFYQNRQTRQESDPLKSHENSLPEIIKGGRADKLIESMERELWLSCGANRAEVMARIQMLEHRIEKERVKWACISAESQRQKKTESGISYVCKIYDNLVSVQPKYERDRGIKPPDNSGNQINKFSKRSRKRLMNRARRLNKEGLPLPFFVTLTYHKNMKDPATGKKHLNVFLQRWRRRSDDFAYFWKMEPQKRGAVHFHLAIFIPQELQNKLKNRIPGNFKNEAEKPEFIEILRGIIQDDWAEVTKEVDGFDVPYTSFDYIRKQKFKNENYQVKGFCRMVKTRCANPKVRYKIEPDFEHRFYGTNVRSVENWKMFLGYMFKYFEKELNENPFGSGGIMGTITSDFEGWERPPARNSAKKPFGRMDIPGFKKREKPTGRFWGFSYNLDFEALKIGIVDHKELENLNDYCNALNALSFATLTEHLTQNAKRKKHELKDRPELLERHLKKYRAIFESQKKRYVMQKNKAKRGYGMQFEIAHRLAFKCESFLRSKSVAEFFDYP